MNEHLVFVYGTLRRGGLRAMPEVFPGSRFVGGASVRGSLYDLGAHPGLLLGGSDSTVVGEVYEVDEETLSKMDAIEASDDYRRRRVEVTLDGGGGACWVYVPEQSPEFYSRRTLIASGDWIEYARTQPETGPETRGPARAGTDDEAGA